VDLFLPGEFEVLHSGEEFVLGFHGCGVEDVAHLVTDDRREFALFGCEDGGVFVERCVDFVEEIVDAEFEAVDNGTVLAFEVVADEAHIKVTPCTDEVHELNVNPRGHVQQLFILNWNNNLSIDELRF
jgi:hypothetical protein